MIYSRERNKVEDVQIVEFSPDTAERFYTADVVDTTRSYARNYGGYCRNDIALINEQDNQEVALSMLDRLRELPHDGSTDKSVEELRQSHRSRYCQTSSEQCIWIENQLEIAENKAKLLAEDERKLELSKQESERRKAFEDSLTSEEREKIRSIRREKELREYAES